MNINLFSEGRTSSSFREPEWMARSITYKCPKGRAKRSYAVICLARSEGFWPYENRTENLSAKWQGRFSKSETGFVRFPLRQYNPKEETMDINELCDVVREIRFAATHVE